MFRKRVVSSILVLLLVVSGVLIVLSLQAGSNSDLAQSDIETRAVKQVEGFNLKGTAQVVASKKTTLAEFHARLDPSQDYVNDPKSVIWIVIIKGRFTFYGPAVPDANGKMAISPITSNYAFEVIDKQGIVTEWGSLSDGHIPNLNGPIVAMYPPCRQSLV